MNKLPSERIREIANSLPHDETMLATLTGVNAILEYFDEQYLEGQKDDLVDSEQNHNRTYRRVVVNRDVKENELISENDLAKLDYDPFTLEPEQMEDFWYICNGESFCGMWSGDENPAMRIREHDGIYKSRDDCDIARRVRKEAIKKLVK